jgi:hypothetical protein
MSPEPSLVPRVADEDVRIEQDHFSASQTTSIGDTMSPMTRIRPFMLPRSEFRDGRTGASIATGRPGS